LSPTAFGRSPSLTRSAAKVCRVGESNAAGGGLLFGDPEQ
jgi:hypothetical protein